MGNAPRQNDLDDALSLALWPPHGLRRGANLTRHGLQAKEFGKRQANPTQQPCLYKAPPAKRRGVDWPATDSRFAVFH